MSTDNSNNSFERLLRDAYVPQLPYGFAERVTRAAMSFDKERSAWDWFASFSPRFTLAIGAAATVLFVFGMTGSGPGILESVTKYSSFSNLLVP